MTRLFRRETPDESLSSAAVQIERHHQAQLAAEAEQAAWNDALRLIGSVMWSADAPEKIRDDTVTLAAILRDGRYGRVAA